MTFKPGWTSLVGSPRTHEPYAFAAVYIGESEGGAIVALPSGASALWEGVGHRGILDSMCASQLDVPLTVITE